LLYILFINKNDEKAEKRPILTDNKILCGKLSRFQHKSTEHADMVGC